MVWVLAFLKCGIVAKIPIRRMYEANRDVFPFTYGRGALASGTSAGRAWFCHDIAQRTLA
jgi:hypothetical protein